MTNFGHYCIIGTLNVPTDIKNGREKQEEVESTLFSDIKSRTVTLLLTLYNARLLIVFRLSP